MIVCILTLNIAEEPQKCRVDIAESVSSFKLNVRAMSNVYIADIYHPHAFSNSEGI